MRSAVGLGSALTAGRNSKLARAEPSGAVGARARPCFEMGLSRIVERCPEEAAACRTPNSASPSARSRRRA